MPVVSLEEVTAGPMPCSALKVNTNIQRSAPWESTPPEAEVDLRIDVEFLEPYVADPPFRADGTTERAVWSSPVRPPNCGPSTADDWHHCGEF